MTTISGINPMIAGARYPDVIPDVVFWRFTSPIRVKTTGPDPFLNRVTSDVLHWDTAKEINQPAGAWNLTLVPGLNDYINILLPGDWCRITADINDGQGERIVMYGPISHITQSISVDQKGATTTRINVEGADFGKAISGTVAMLDAALAKDSAFGASALSKITKQVTAAGASHSGEIIKAILKNWYNATTEQCINPMTGKIFASELDQNWIDTSIDGESAWQSVMVASPLWQVIQQWSNPAIAETFLDLRPDINKPDDLVKLKPALVHRRHPFFGSALNKLTTVQVLSTEVCQLTMGRSDDDVCNWIRVTDEQSIGGLPEGSLVTYYNIGYYNPESIKRFGVRRHEPITAYCYDVANAKNNPASRPMSLPKMLAQYTEFNAAWHHSNEYLYSGSMTTYLRPDIRIGYKLAYVDTETKRVLEAYIEGVHHQYEYPGLMTTTIIFTRGRYTDSKDKRFTWNPAQLKSNGILASLGSTDQRAKGNTY